MMKKGLVFIFSFLFTSSVFSATLPADIKPTDLRSYGAKTTPVSVYVFSSLSCPHCASFHQTVMPKLLSEYVDKGKIRLVYVDMPGDPISMTGTTISRCISPDKYESFMSIMFENQMMVFNASKPREVMTRFATMLGGMSKNDVNVCLADEKLKKTILDQRTNLATLYDIKGMPSTVVVKGNKTKKIEGADEIEILRTIDERLAD